MGNKIIIAQERQHRMHEKIYKKARQHSRRLSLFAKILLFNALVLSVSSRCLADENTVFSIRLYIDFADSPIFTPLFKSGLARHVSGQLNGYFGPLADCKIITSGDDHWFAKKMQSHENIPLRIESKWLAENRTSSSEKIGFAYIDYVQSAYRLRLQVADVDTGWISPLRTRLIPDRQMVSQVICEMFLENFPITIDLKKLTTNDGSQMATVTYKGGSRMKRIQSKLEKHPYFKIYIKQPGGGEGGAVKRREIPDTVLYFNPSESESKGKVFSRYANIFRYPNADYEAISLPTQKGRIRLQIVDRKTRRGASTCVVRVSDKQDFDSNESKVLGNPSLSNGNVDQSQIYRDIVFVKIEQGGKLANSFPIPIIESDATFFREVDMDRQGAAGINLSQSLRRLNSMVDSLNKYQKFTKQLSIDKQRDQLYEKALELANELSEEYQNEADLIREDFLEIGTLPSDAPSWQKQSLQNVKNFLIKQPEINKENNTWAEKLKNLIEFGGKKALAEAEIELGNAAINDCPYDAEQAIIHFDKAMELLQDAAEIETDSDSEAFSLQLKQFENKALEVKEVWEIKSEAHRKAREYVQLARSADYADQIETHLPVIKQNDYINILRQHCDKFTLLQIECIVASCEIGLYDFIGSIADEEQSPEDIDRYKKQDELIKEIKKNTRRARRECIEADNASESTDAELAPNSTDAE